jgi:hypothetical protein
MAEARTAIEGFIHWLPGELVYSARKAGYDKKIERARLPLFDPRSVHGFLGTEWHNYQLLKAQGAHYKPFHGMSAQLQLAKFAAGLFDKAALAVWLASGTEASEENFVAAAEQIGSEVTDLLPAPRGQLGPYGYIDRPFEETPFSEGIAQIMQTIVEVTRLEGAKKMTAGARLKATTINLGGLAANCYLVYGHEHLTAEQYNLPVSVLAS